MGVGMPVCLVCWYPIGRWGMLGMLVCWYANGGWSMLGMLVCWYANGVLGMLGMLVCGGPQGICAPMTPPNKNPRQPKYTDANLYKYLVGGVTDHSSTE